jgi:hypothetical protein
MNKRFASPLQSEFNDRNEMYQASSKKGDNLYVKRYPNFFKREDVHGDFVAVQREIRNSMPDVRIIKEDVDANFAHIQFDAAPAQEVMLEKLLAKRGFIKSNKAR